MPVIGDAFESISVSDDGETWIPILWDWQYSEDIRLSDGRLIHCDLREPLDDEEREILRRYLEDVIFPIGEEHG